VSACLCFADDPVVFPKRPVNRAALTRIDYRIGAYADFRAEMLRRLNLQQQLGDWTHREADDPGIALIEGAAILGDILTFYQDLYANEAYLRTARWRESVAELVRLLGYRLAPGLAGHGAFAFEIKGTQPLVIPAGFGIEADLEGADDQAEFETDEDAIAYPDLSRFNLYRPRTYSAAVEQNKSRLEIAAIEGASTPDVLQSAALKVGDRLMLMPDESVWSTRRSFTPQAEAQIVKLTRITHTLDRTILEFEGGLTAANWTAPITAYRIGRAFRHFGHNAPPKVVITELSSGKITGATQRDASFGRDFASSFSSEDWSRELPPNLIPLDKEVNDLVVGKRIVVQTTATIQVWSSWGWWRLGLWLSRPFPLAVARNIGGLSNETLGFGNLNAAATTVQLTPNLIANSALVGSQTADIRKFQIYEVTSPELQLRNVASFEDGAQTTGDLQFFGTHEQVRLLAGRRLLLQHEDGRAADLTCIDTPATFPLPDGPDFVRPWTIHLNKAPAGFLKADFDEAAPKITVFGNVVEAAQGKTQREATLGNGDNRQTFQTFKLPKSPLTYQAAPGTPPQKPQLDVRVNGVLWQRVDSFFGRASREQIYIVREDANGDSFVQFGDGETGARLPSGIDNISAHFRSGNGAHGKLKPDAKPSPGGQLKDLDKVQLPDVISGGAEPEKAENAREAAPGKIQSLGRLVSLRDFETETLSIAGVTKVAASWALDGGVPGVELIVLLEAGRASEITSVKQTVAEYQHCRGPNRFPVKVTQGTLRYLFLDVRYACDPRLQRETVEAQIRVALGAGNDDAARHFGQFALRNRRFGEREYKTRLAGCVQNVAGVRWCEVIAFGLFPAGVDPALLVLPAEPKPLTATVPCGNTEVLQLDPAHLRLIAAPPPPTDPCEP
jgi:hypothetical protein